MKTRLPLRPIGGPCYKTLLRTGEQVELDGTAGRVTRLSAPAT